MTVVMALGSNPQESRIFIGETDITESVRSVEVRACMGELTQVVITLVSAVEIIGHAKVEFKGDMR